VATPKAKHADGAPVIVHDVSGCVMAVWRNSLIVIWGSAGTIPLAVRLDELSSSLVQEYPEGFSSLHFIVNGAGLPDAAAREELKKVAARYAKHIACLGTVIDGSGFWASAIRSFFTSLLLFSRLPYKAHFAASIPELAEWVVGPHEERTRVRLSPEELKRAMFDVRARLR
jgi:hypothetical protein